MDDSLKRTSELLHRAAETHHAVFAITDGADEDWASWYSDWLVRTSHGRTTTPEGSWRTSRPNEPFPYRP